MHFRRILLERCPSACSDELARYWDECALEHMCSGGRAMSDRRKFNGRTLYRSDYLDRLAEQVRGQDLGADGFSAGNGLSLEPCIRQIEIASIRGGPAGAASIRSIDTALEDVKEEEAVALEVNTEGWGNKKSDVARCLMAIAPSHGFALNGRWCERADGFGNVLRCTVDTGGRSDCAATLPIRFEAVGRGEIYDLSLTNLLVPGFVHYAKFRSARTGVLGLCAHVTLFSVLADLLGFAKTQR
jgi:hypothetical protein